MKMTRREFLKLSTATALTATTMCAFDGWVNPDEALAASDAPEEVKYTHCVQCNHGPRCGLKVIMKEGKIYRVEKRPDYPNQNICAKGVASVQEIYNPNRLLHPMKRTNPKGEPAQWEQITWEEALQTIAEKLNGIKEQYGAEKVLFATGDPKEPRCALQRLAYTFGSPNMGTESSTCYKAVELATKLIYGPEWHTASSLATGGAGTPGKTKVCIIWGNNFAWSAPVSYNGLCNAKEGGQIKYICIDPRVTPVTEKMADIHLQPRPGTDGAMALCFGRGLIEADAYDKDFIENWAHGFEEYKEYVQQFTVEKTAEITDVPAEKIQAAIDMLVEGVKEGGPIIVKSSAAYGHHKNGVNTWRAIQLLIPLTGSLDVPGGETIADEPLNFDEWQMTFDFSRSNTLLPELDHLRVDREYRPVWADTDQQGSVQLNFIPEYVKTGAIRAAFCLGTNLMMWPGTPEYQEAFKNMDFCCTADFYIKPQTHDYFDMILPAAMSFERSCPITVFGRKLFLREPIIEPLGEARSDYRICCDVGTALGYSEDFFGGGPESEVNCIKESLKYLDVDTPITYEDLKAAAPGCVTVPMRGEHHDKKYELGLLRADGQPGFSSPSGKVEFTSEILREHGMDPLPIFEEPTYGPNTTPELMEEYPIILNTGNRMPMFCHSKLRNVPWTRNLSPDPIVRINPIDAEARGIVEGDDVVISSPEGREITAKAEVTVMIRPGCMDMFHGWAEANVNLLHARDFDPISGFPSFKEGLCQIKKA